MVRKFTTKEEYEAFYKRIQTAFVPEEMSPQAITEYLNHDSLSDQLGLVRELAEDIKFSDSIPELKELRSEVDKLPVHKETLLTRIEERIEEIEISVKEERIATTITVTEEFAEEKRILLSEKTFGNVYPRWGRNLKPAVVIFKNGKIKTWRHLTEDEIKELF